MKLAHSTTVLLIDRALGGGETDPWREALGSDPGVRIVVVEPEPGWWVDVPQSLGLAGADEVLVGELGSVPGPDLLTRMRVCRDGRPPGTVVDARVLPVEVTRVAAEPRNPDATPTVEPESPAVVAARAIRLGARPRTSAACTLLDVVTLRSVGEVWEAAYDAERGAHLEERVVASAHEVVVEPTATIFLGLRVDADGVPRAPEHDADDDDDTSDPFTPPVNLHPAALPATSVSTVLSTVGLEWSTPPYDADATRPFLTVVTRTQGRRTQCLEEMFTCLAGQTTRDFEVLLMCHRVAAADLESVQGVVDALPSWLHSRVRLVQVDRSGRAAPLNDGFAAARGRYIAMLDDDDTVLARWVEAFATLEQRAPGRLLRTATIRQNVIPLAGHPQLVAVPLGNTFAAWPPTFELVDHLRANYSPCMSMAFPRGASHDLGFRFDESLETTEDWDFLVRVAGVVGAESSEEVTSVYRWWLSTASSREAHDKAAWEDAHRRVLAKIDDSVILLPPGAARRFRETTNEGWDEAAALASSQHQVILELTKTAAAHDQAVDNWHAAEERATNANTRAQKWREKLVKRTERFEQRLTLIRHADELVRTRSAQEPDTPIPQMSVAQLQAFVAEAEKAPERRPSRALGLRLRRGEGRS